MSYKIIKNSNIYKVIKQTNVEQPWVQPVLTSNTSYGTLTGNQLSPYYLYKISDGVDDNVDYCWDVGTGTSGYLNWALPVTLRITGIQVSWRSGDRPNGNVSIYTDSSKATQIGDTTSHDSTHKLVQVQNIPANGIVTNNLYIEISSSQNYPGIDEIYITATVVDQTSASTSYKVVQKGGDDGDTGIVFEENTVLTNSLGLPLYPQSDYDDFTMPSNLEIPMVNWQENDYTGDYEVVNVTKAIPSSQLGMDLGSIYNLNPTVGNTYYIPTFYINQIEYPNPYLVYGGLYNSMQDALDALDTGISLSYPRLTPALTREHCAIIFKVTWLGYDDPAGICCFTNAYLQS